MAKRFTKFTALLLILCLVISAGAAFAEEAAEQAEPENAAEELLAEAADTEEPEDTAEPAAAVTEEPTSEPESGESAEEPADEPAEESAEEPAEEQAPSMPAIETQADLGDTWAYAYAGEGTFAEGTRIDLAAPDWQMIGQLLNSADESVFYLANAFAVSFVNEDGTAAAAQSDVLLKMAATTAPVLGEGQEVTGSSVYYVDAYGNASPVYSAVINGYAADIYTAYPGTYVLVTEVKAAQPETEEAQEEPAPEEDAEEPESEEPENTEPEDSTEAPEGSTEAPENAEPEQPESIEPETKEEPETLKETEEETTTAKPEEEEEEEEETIDPLFDNTSAAEAKAISVNTFYSDKTSSGSQSRYYSFSISSAGYVSLTFDHAFMETSTSYWNVYLYPKDSSTALMSFSVRGDSTSTTGCNIGLPAGSYLVKVSPYSTYTYNTSTYQIKANYVQSSIWEREFNDARSSATSISVNTAYCGSIRSSNDVDFYTFTTTKDGYVSLSFEHNYSDSSSTYWYIYLYPNDNSSELVYFSSAGNQLALSSCNIGLPAGTYQVKVIPYSTYTWSSRDYTLTVNYNASAYWEREFNDSQSAANSVKTNTYYSGTVRSGSDVDWYQFSVSGETWLYFQFDHGYVDSTGNYFKMILYYSNMQSVGEYYFTGSESSDYRYIYVPGGTYYMKITPYSSYSWIWNYDFCITPLSGWSKIDGDWYYYNGDGSLYYGWLKENGKWYYLDEYDGIMQTGWQKISGKWYFFDKSGVMQTGWVKDDNKWYYFNNSGIMQTGWKEIDSTWYYFASDGEMQVGWAQINGKWYHFSSKGAMQTGWQEIGGKWYHFTSGGAMHTGWQEINEKWYYFGSDGAMRTGWKEIGGKWYHFSSKGVMHTGWKEIGGKWYHFTSGGAMHTGWQEIKGKWYYFGSDGAMRTGWQTIGGKKYYFDSNGVWIK